MIRLHHVPLARSFRTLWLMEEQGLEFDISYYSIRDGSLRSPDYLALSPLGRVPALEIDGTVLFESGAITEYLCERAGGSDLGRVMGHSERPKFLEALHFAETMANQIEQLNMSHLFLRDPAMASPVVIKLNTARLGAATAALDHMLEGQDWILPSGFSAADTMLASNLLLSRYYVPLDHFAHVRAYAERAAARPAHQRAWARNGEQDFYKRDFYPVPEH